ncbi:Spc97/Spc98 family protein [Xylariaceae sp. FL0804]|nr:Spc97/Spc98 family protein [Xylariaceae sp. FL0804]
MLHEILLSLSGHPSPLLRNDHPDSAAGASVLSPPERELLAAAGHLSDLHCKLLSYAAQIGAAHPSVICRAVASAVESVHLAAFQAKILEVEDGVLRRDAALVGAYDIVPLTAVMAEFSGWTRRLEWLWDLVRFIAAGDRRDGQPSSSSSCRAAPLIDRLRGELQTGYADIGETALSLLRVAETAWLKQVSAWVLYGRLPALADNDFFIREDEAAEQGYSVDHDLLPCFVAPSTATSMLFIGTCLNRVRARSGTDPSVSGVGQLSSRIQELARLTFPINGATFTRAITAVRLHLSRTTLQKLLPLARVHEILLVLREFFLLGRGEFAMALTQQADEKIRNRWRRADNLAYQERDGIGTVVVKEGEVATALARTWAVLGSMLGQHADEDEGLELARDLLRLELFKPSSTAASKGTTDSGQHILRTIATTPFNNLLFSVPVDLTMHIPPPLDLFLSSSDLQVYTAINAYLLSVRRAHLRLTDLWKISSLRRHHPPPPRAPHGNTKAGIARTRLLRERWSARSLVMRRAWSTSSAAIFFLAETEAYLQVEVVEGLWSHFHAWLMGGGDHDPQSLSAAHRLYLGALARRLLLLNTKTTTTTTSTTTTTTRQGGGPASPSTFTEALHALLARADHLAAAVRRLHGVWAARDLEADEGVVDAFAGGSRAEEADAAQALRAAGDRVRAAVAAAVAALRALSVDGTFLAEMEGVGGGGGGVGEEEDGNEGRYVPRRIGGVDRLLMKLDFGGWLDGLEGGNGHGHGHGHDGGDYGF